MILICDRHVSARAMGLREEILTLGCPCAVSAISDIKMYLPVRLIITFCDVFNDVRRTPYDSIFVIAIGNGFVNTALNAKRADDVDSAVQEAREYLYCLAKVDEEDILPSGVCASDMFFADDFFEVYGNMVEPTGIEYMIFKYLLACTSDKHFADKEKIREFCYPSDSNAHASNTIAVHISNLNRKIFDAYGKKLIKAKRFAGYFIDKI